MPNKNDIWNEAFNSPDLSSEDWLEPSTDLYNRIEKEIAPPKKKRRFGFMVFLVGFISVLFVAGFYVYDSLLLDMNDSVESTTSMDNPKSTTSKVHNSDSFSSINKETIDTETNTNLSVVSNNEINNSLSKAQNVKVGYDQRIESEMQSTDHLYAIDRDLETDFSEVTSEATSASSSSFTYTSTSFLKAPLAVAKKEILTVSDADRNESILSPFNAKDYFLEVSERPLLIAAVTVNELNTPVDKNTISFFTGVSKWGFHLNSNYLTALDPADFTFEEGSGKTMALKYEYHVKNRISLFGSVSWDRVISYSGHNSNVNYDLQNESGDLSNTLDLTMASPFGLIQSDVVIARNAAVGVDQTSLVLDLHNRHQFDNIGVSTGLVYSLMQNSGFECSTHLGVGINYLVGLENELESFDLSSSDFSSGQTSITQDQQAVNKFSTQLNLGVNLRRSIGENTRLGVSFDYVRGLSDVYREDDFSSRLSARRYQLSLSRRF